MRNAILLTLAGIFLISLLTIGITYLLPPPPPPVRPEPSSSAQIAPNRTEFPYLLRAYDGKLAIFTSDLVTPDLVFDVYVRTLPEYDQEQLARGVRAKSYEDLTKLVEDYIS